MTPRRPALSGIERRERQRAFWRRKYAHDPAFFGEAESEFARWCLPRLRADRKVRELVDLGCGYGRDTRFFGTQGFRVRGVDFAGVPPARTRRSRNPWGFVESDCGEFLQRQRPGSVDAVYSNMLFNMDFTEAEHRSLFGEVCRALRPGGWHLYSVRSITDPWYGRGRQVGPDTFDPAPHGITMHYFSKQYVDRLGANGFEPVARAERWEGRQDFPIRLWYVADRKLGRRESSRRETADREVERTALRDPRARPTGQHLR